MRNFAMKRLSLHRALGLAALLILSYMPAAVAQNLLRSEEGRLVVGQCYATCMDRLTRSVDKAQERHDRELTRIISDDFSALPLESQNLVMAMDRTASCVWAQNNMRDMDGCYAGCADAEAAYGVKAAHARNRFHHLLRGRRLILQEAGLWFDYKTAPPPGSVAFDEACDRFLGNPNDPLLTNSRIPATISLLESLRGLEAGLEKRRRKEPDGTEQRPPR